MANVHKKEEWLKEFAEFSDASFEQVVAPPASLDKIKARLFPDPWIVFAKVTAIHLVVGFLSLAICNQFGLNPFNTSQSLTDWFMKIAGHNFCMILCGTFFIATTYVLSNLVLNLEELESIKRYEWLQTGIICLISLAVFYFFGAELLGTFVGLWLMGAIIGGYLSIEGSYRFRRMWA